MNLKSESSCQLPLILLIGFFLYMSNFMATATVSLFADTMSATASVVGLIGGIFGFVSLGIRPFSGQIVDRENTRFVLFIGICLIIASNLSILFAKAPIMLLISRGLFGLAWGICSTLLMTASCNSVSTAKMPFAINAFTMIQALSQLLGPYAALKLLNSYSFSFLYTITLIFSLLAFLLALFYNPRQKGNQSLRYTFKFNEFFSASCWPPIVLCIGNYMIIHAVNAFIVLYATSLDIPDLSWYFAIQAGVMLTVRPLMAALTKGDYSKGFVVICELIMICGAVILFVPFGVLSFVISAVLLGVANAGAHPALMSLSVKSSPAEQRGKATNSNYTGCDVGAFIGPFVSGCIVQLLGYKYVFLALSVFLGILLCVFISHFKTLASEHK